MGFYNDYDDYDDPGEDNDDDDDNAIGNTANNDDDVNDDAIGVTVLGTGMNSGSTMNHFSRSFLR